MLPKNHTKNKIVGILRSFNNPKNMFYEFPMTLDYLANDFPIFNHLLSLLIKDKFVSKIDKQFVKELYKNTTKKFKKNN